MNSFNLLSKTTLAILFCCFLSFASNAQSTYSKPKLEFEAKINPTNKTIEITWATCLENTVLTLLDKNEVPLKSFSLCKDNTVIDVTGLAKGTYVLKVEHYTGLGMQEIEIK